MDFIGNKKPLVFLEKSLVKGDFSHAYLFSGPEGVGKFLLAKAFAAGIIEGKGIDFAKEENESLPLDLLIIAPEIEEKNGKKRIKGIAIEKIRDIQKELATYPYSGNKKVLIIDGAHEMSISSQNALLKILEEPNSTSVVILVTHEESKVLSTIKSRCQRIRFSLVSDDEMLPMKAFCPKTMFETYVSMSMGRPGFFSNLTRNEEKSFFCKSVHDELNIINRKSVGERLAYAENLSKDSSEAVEALNIWSWMLRKKSLESENLIAENYRLIERIEVTVTSLKNTNASARLVLESLFLEI